MDYKNINDNEILYLISDNNDEYKNILFEKYKPIVLSVAKTYMKVNTDTVLDYDDLVQIGFLGLNNAIRFYKEENTLFFTFACLCIRNAVAKEVYKRNYKKEWNHYVFSSFDEKNHSDLNQITSQDTVYTKDLFYRIKNNLLFFDSCVFVLRMSGFRYKEIAILLDTKIEKIDYSIQKTRRKLKKVL